MAPFWQYEPLHKPLQGESNDGNASTQRPQKNSMHSVPHNAQSRKGNYKSKHFGDEAPPWISQSTPLAEINLWHSIPLMDFTLKSNFSIRANKLNSVIGRRNTIQMISALDPKTRNIYWNSTLKSSPIRHDKMQQAQGGHPQRGGDH